MNREISTHKKPIDIRCLQFAVRIIKYSDKLKQEKGFEISSQIIKSGTSVGANLREANNAVSKADFLNKLAISQKEMSETIYWLELMAEIREGKEEAILLSEANQIFKILKTISINTKKNMGL